MKSRVARLSRSPGSTFGTPGRVCGQRFGGDTPLGRRERDRLLRPEERVARGHLGRAPRRRRRECVARRVGLASGASRRRRGARRAAAHRSRRRARRCRTPRRLRSRRRARTRCRAPCAGTGRSCCRSRPCRARRPRPAADPRRRRSPPRRSPRRARRGPGSRRCGGAGPSGRRASRRAARLPATTFWRRAASREAVSSALGLVDSTSVTERSTMLPSMRSEPRCRIGRLREAAAELVDRVEDHVGAAGERVRRQLVGEREVGAPRLVDDERDVASVGDLGEAGDVGDGAEVGGGDGERRDRIGDLVDRGRERRRGQAVGDAELVVDHGGDERRLASRSAPVRRSPRSGRCAARSPNRRGGRAPCRSRGCLPDAPLTRNQLRFAPQASAASRWARWKGVLRGSGPTSTSSVPDGKSSLSAFSPSASMRPLSAPAPPLWPGMWNRPTSRAASATSASRYGVSVWSTPPP